MGLETSPRSYLPKLVTRGTGSPALRGGHLPDCCDDRLTSSHLHGLALYPVSNPHHHQLESEVERRRFFGSLNPLSDVEVSDLRALLPLAKGPLREFRREVRLRLVISALARMGKADVKPEDVRNTLVSSLGLRDFPLEVVVGQLEALAAKGIIKSVGGGYSIVSLPKLRDFDALIRQVVTEFTLVLKEKDADYDPYDYREIDKAVEKSVLGLAVAMLTAIRSGARMELAAPPESVRSELLLPWKDAGAKLNLAGKAFIAFLLSDSPAASALVASIYETCLAVDMLSRGAQLEVAIKEAAPPDRIYLDTNCLSAMLTPTNRYHDIIIASARLARRLGFQVGFVAHTMLELNHLIQAATRSLNQGDVVEAARRNEFVFDFTKRLAGQKWSDRLAELGAWPHWLRDEAGVVQFDAPDHLDRSEKEQSFEAVFQIILNSHGESREASAIRHDVYLYGVVQARKTTLSGLFDSPTIETLDRFLWETNNILVKTKAYPNAVVHATQWLNTLSQFVDAELDEKDIGLTVRGILRSLVEHTEPGLTVDEYTRLLAARYDLEPKQALIIAQVLTESVLRAELEKALKEFDADNTAIVTQRIFDDGKLIDAVVGRERAEADAAEMRKRMQEMRGEIQESRKVIQYLREAATRSVVVEVHVSGVPDSAVFLFEKLLAEIESRMPEIAKAQGIDKSMARSPDRGAFKKAVEKVEVFLQRAAADVAAAQTLIPVVVQILWILQAH